MDGIKTKIMIGIMVIALAIGCFGIFKGLGLGEKKQAKDTSGSESIEGEGALASANKQTLDRVYEPIATYENAVVSEEKLSAAALDEEDVANDEETAEDAEDTEDGETADEIPADSEDEGKDDSNDETAEDAEEPAEEALAAPASPVAESAKLIITGTDINIRSEANSEAEILGLAYNGTSYKWLPELSTNEWFAFDYNGTTAYIKSLYVEIEKEGEFTETEQGLISIAAQLKQLAELEQKKEQEYQAQLAQLQSLNAATPTPTAVPTQPVKQQTTQQTTTQTVQNTVKPTSTPVPTKAATTSYTRSGPVQITNDGPYSDELLLFSVVATEPSPNYQEQLAAASVVVNLMKYQNRTMNQVLSAPGQFTGYASGYLFRTIETYLSGNYPARFDQCMQAARDVLQNGPTIPYLMFIVPWDGIEQWAPNGQRIGMSYFYTKVFV